MKTQAFPASFHRCIGTLMPAFALSLLSPALSAHSHVDVQAAPSGQLTLVGATGETMVYVPPGEPFTLYAPQFPGGYYVTELTFSSEDPLTPNALPHIQLLSVSGPTGASFAFWEAGATAPTWSRATGWTASAGDHPEFITYEDESGVGHIHGRLFTATHPGTYTVTFRAIDGTTTAPRTASAPYVATIEVLATPPLSIRAEGDFARLSFTSRVDLTYDLQVSTDLLTWNNVPAHQFVAGTGVSIEITDSLAGRHRVFYRLVEYR
jgi:hypothetical protein